MSLVKQDLEGRPHYVVPMVMITVGVHNGSQGPIFYPADELRKSAPFWNGKPIVVFHPAMYSDGFAGNPEVFNRQKVGTIFNTRFVKNALKADAWLDLTRCDVLDKRILDAIGAGRMTEVSTGLVFSNDGSTGTFNRASYGAVARNIQPDHLAILPEGRGACSIADGAGLLRNERVEALVSA